MLARQHSFGHTVGCKHSSVDTSSLGLYVVHNSCCCPCMATCFLAQKRSVSKTRSSLHNTHHTLTGVTDLRYVIKCAAAVVHGVAAL